MRYELEVNGRIRQVLVNRVEDLFEVTVDGRSWRVRAERIDAYTLSLDLSRGSTDAPHPRRVRDVIVAPDPAPGVSIIHIDGAAVPVVLNGRRRAGSDDRHKPVGPQRVVAPMPGKIVRVVVKPGEAVCARQPLVVVEAMKMENELRATRDGIVAELHAAEGMSVESGALLVLIQ